MAPNSEFAELVPKEIRQSRLFVAAVLDSKGNILYYTDSLLGMFNSTAPKQQLHYTDIIFSEDLERLRDALTLCLIGKTVSSLNIRMQSRPGEPQQQVLWEFTPASSSHDDEALVLCIGTRLQSVEPMRKAEHAADDSEVVNNLLRRNRDLEQFANIVAHNIRSPLANIMGLNRLLGLELSEADKATALKGINTSAEKLENVIRDLNDVLQIRKTDTSPKDAIDLTTVVEDIRQSISGMIAQSKATITCDFVCAPVVYSIRSYIQSIFLNMITNAIKYSRPGFAPTITVQSQMDSGALVLRFADNGIGIDLEKHGANMFGLYKRFSDRPDGKGLGLYMVKTQIEALDGTIEVESTLGAGTEFIITIPQ
jgi:signal transduction histidine kinase